MALAELGRVEEVEWLLVDVDGLVDLIVLADRGITADLKVILASLKHIHRLAQIVVLPCCHALVLSISVLQHLQICLQLFELLLVLLDPLLVVVEEEVQVDLLIELELRIVFF